MIRRMMAFCLFMLILIPCIGFAETTYWVELRVVDADTGEGVSGASVQFWHPADSYVARRNPTAAMMATEDPSRPGFYHHQIKVDDDAAGRVDYLFLVRKQGFDEFESSITLRKGSETAKRETVRIKREPLRGQAVHVTVLRTDSDDGIHEAWIRICNESGTTDANGKVTLQFNAAVEGGLCEVFIQRDSYYPISGYKIRVSMLDDDARHQSITCRLKSINITGPGAAPSGCEPPTKSARSPEEQQRRFLKVRVTVTDKTDASLPPNRRPAVSGATLTLTLYPATVRPVKEIQPGVYEFELNPDSDAGKNGTLTFKKHGFRDVTTLVSGSQLTPGPQAVPIYMETEKRDSVREVIDALNADMEKKTQALYEACDALGKSQDQIREYQIAAYGLWTGFNKFRSLVERAQRECLTVPSLRAQIRAQVSKAKTSEAALQARLDQANALAARCRTRADADQLEALWNEIKKLSWDVHLTGGQAEGFNNRMNGIISRAAVLTSRFDTVDTETPVPLSQFPGKAREMLEAIKALRSPGAFGQAYQQARTKRQQAVQAYNDAINKIDSYIDPADRSDPRVAAFKRRVRSQIPAIPKACNEEEARQTLDKYISDLSKGIEKFTKDIQDLKTKNPLCASEKSEDASVREAQGSQAIITLVTGSDIPTKLQICRTNAGSTTTTGPAPPAKKSPDDDGDGVPNNKDKCPGTPAGHPVDANGCSLLQRFARAKMWIEGPETIKSGQPTWYKAKGDSEFASLLSGLTGAPIYEWSVNGKPAGRGTENFQYNLPAGSAGSLTIMARLLWVNTRSLNEVEVKRAQGTFTVLTSTPGAMVRKKYGPFNVPWGDWFPTGISIKKGETFEVKATGTYKSANQKSDIKEVGPGGAPPWGWFVLKAKIGTQVQDVGGGSKTVTALQDGPIQLGSPRGNEFVKEDAGNCTGSLSVEVWVDEKSGPR